MFETIEQLMKAIKKYGVSSFATEVVGDIYDVWSRPHEIQFEGQTLHCRVVETEGGEGQGDYATSVVEFEGLGHIRFDYGHYSGEGYYTDSMEAKVVRLVTKTVQVYE